MKKNATSRKKATVVKKVAPVINRRSVITAFEYKEYCIFCGLTAKYDGKKRGFDVIPIKTQEFQNSIAQVCKARNDEWWITVLGRIEYALIFVARMPCTIRHVALTFALENRSRINMSLTAPPTKQRDYGKEGQKTQLKTQHF